MIFLDLETTGATPMVDRIIEIGLVKIENGEATEWKTFVNPGVPIPFKLQEILLSDVVITTQLAIRGSREFSLASETAFDAIYAKILAGDETALQDICYFALKLCKAETVGLSLLGFIGDRHVFNWAITAGNVPKFKIYSPINDCPCGTVLDMYSYQVFQHPENHYPWVKANKFVIPEMISMPIYRDDLTALGTFWVMHREGNHFDWEDVRILTTLVSFIKTASRSDKFKEALTFS